jgi:hypothetical protein
MSEVIGGGVGAAAIAGCAAVLHGLDTRVGDAERVEQLRALEELKSAAAAAQARVTAAFAGSQRAAQAAAGTPARQVGRGIAAQVALARRDSPARGSRHLGLATALVHEMPHTLAALERGQISEWRATVLVRETACLSRADRARVDAELAARPGGLGALGDRATAAQARRVAYRLDPYACTARARTAAGGRRVTIRPAPDTMTQVTGLLPAPQGVAVYAALGRHADRLRAGGDARTRGQIMADTLVERVTGQTTAPGVPVEVDVLISDRSLAGADDEPADLAGYGPLPAPLTRAWLRETGARAWWRRLYADPHTGQLVAMESSRREFTGGLRRFVVGRDRVCRTPWCEAPIRHVDHIKPAAEGGATTAANGQGLCEACNYTKQATGWRALALPDGTIVTHTPTGHRYHSHTPRLHHPPPQPPPQPADPPSPLETRFREIILATAG